jgi:tetratricopeptide (TPR) repeat protein
MMGRLRALAVGLSLCSAGLAAAQPRPTDSQKQQAGDLVKKAIARSQAGDHQGAIDLYLQAYAIIPQPLLLSNVGAEYQQSQKPVEALKYFCMYLDKDPTGTNATYATSQAKILQVGMGNKDGEVCKPPKPPEPEPPVATPTPDPVPAPPPVTGPTSETMMPRSGGKLRMAGLVTITAGVASAGLGVFFGVKAKQNSDLISEHDKAMSWPENIHDIEAQGQSYENKQVIFLVAGGALTVTGVVLLVAGRSKRSPGYVLAPTATPDSVGVSLGGGF